MKETSQIDVETERRLQTLNQRIERRQKKANRLKRKAFKLLAELREYVLKNNL